MAQKAQAVVLKDFRGGIWLNEGEPPDPTYASFLFNLDILAGGGLQKRAPVRLNYTKTSLDVITLGGTHQMMQADPTVGTRYVLLDQIPAGQGHIITYDTSTSTAIGQDNIVLPVTSFAFGSSQAGNFWYTFQPTTVRRSLVGGGGGATLATTFNDNLANPLNGSMPGAQMGTQHLAYFFIANTTESSVNFPNRIRWSHPGRFEDWRTNDNIDVGDTAPIRGIYSVRETLLIVKQTSVWVLYGYSPQTFSVRKVVDLPAVSTNIAIAACGNSQKGAFVFVQRAGVFNWDGQAWRDVSGGIKDAVIDGRCFIYNMAIVGDYLFMSGQDPNASTSNFATAASWQYHIPSGRWAMQNAAFTGLCEVSPQSTPVAKGYSLQWAGTTPDTYSFGWYQQQQDIPNWIDNITGTDVEIVAEYRSPWFDGGNPAMKKRFRRPRVVFNKRPSLSTAGTTSYNIRVYKNWDGIHVAKSGTVQSFKAADSVGYSNFHGYGHGINPTDGADFDEGLKLTTLGTGFAAQLRIDSTGTPPEQWGFDSITIPFLPKRLH